MKDVADMTEEELRLFSLPTDEDPLYKKRLKCSECGVRHTLKWNALVNRELKEARLCHDCYFWVAKIGIERAVRVGHQHFMIGENFEGMGFRGYGGRNFRIYFFEGRVVETNNLWSQGDIPERFWDRLPDNARLVSEDTEWEEIVKRYPPMP